MDSSNECTRWVKRNVQNLTLLDKLWPGQVLGRSGADKTERGLEGLLSDRRGALHALKSDCEDIL
jgi:hypothetical protein